MPPVISGRSMDGRVTVDGADLLMLGSNDYLGLSTHPAVIAATVEALARYGTGCAIYPTLCGTELHSVVQDELAAFLGVEAALLFSSGGAANAGVLTTLAQEGDLIVSDRRNHASIIDGARHSRASVMIYESCDVRDLERVLTAHQGHPRKLVITDGVFSMEGRMAPVTEILGLCRRHGATLIVDEAHATGVVGPGGKGSLPALDIANAATDIMLTGSLSKALGSAGGGFVAGPRELIEIVATRARSYIFTQGMTTAALASTLAAVRLARLDPSILERLWSNVAAFRGALEKSGVSIMQSDSAILSASIGDEEDAATISSVLRFRGLFVPALFFPIVAKGDARLRMQISAAHDPAQLEMAASTIAVAIADAW